jgi:hypothetical protein
MSVLLAAALAAAIQPSCSWDRPGHNPYTGSTAAAIDRYTDIPAAVRSTLKRRIEEKQADDNVNITRDAIGGKNKYDPAIHDMHFGAASLCNNVTRSKWTEARSEPGAVYCVGEHCILVPKICGNVSRITKLAPGQAPATAAAQSIEADKPAQFADVSLADPEARDASPLQLGQMDELDPDAKPKRMPRLAGSSANGVGVDEFELSDELDLDDMADQFARRMAFGVGLDGDGTIHTAVPEAETWAMLLSGLGLMGWVARRRKTAAKAAV